MNQPRIITKDQLNSLRNLLDSISESEFDELTITENEMRSIGVRVYAGKDDFLGQNITIPPSGITRGDFIKPRGKDDD